MNKQSKLIIEILESQYHQFSLGASWYEGDGSIYPEIALRLLSLDDKFIKETEELKWVLRLANAADKAYYLEPEQGTEGYGTIFVQFWNYWMAYNVFWWNGFGEKIKAEISKLPSNLYGTENLGRYENGIWYS